MTTPVGQRCPARQVIFAGAAAIAMLSFFDAVDADIHAQDPTHLVEEGLLGGGQCGTSGPDYENVGASPGIDVLSVHDYYGITTLGGDPWNGLTQRFAQAALGIDFNEVGQTLQQEGVESFSKSFEELLAAIKKQRDAVLAK